MMRFAPVCWYRQIRVVLLVIRRGHEYLHVLSDQFGSRVPEDPLRRGVDRLDDAAAVDRDDRVHRGVEDGPQPGAALKYLRVHPLAVGPFPGDDRRADEAALGAQIGESVSATYTREPSFRSIKVSSLLIRSPRRTLSMTWSNLSRTSGGTSIAIGRPTASACV